MAVQWRQVPIPFVAGVDTKRDRKTADAPKLLTLQNGVFTKEKTIVKRNGYLKLSDQTNETTPRTISSAEACASLGNELLLFDGKEAYSYEEVEARWIPRGDFEPVVTTRETVADTTSTQTKADCATLDGVTVFAWEDSRGGIRYSVRDSNTKAVYTHDTQLSATASIPRCIAIGGNLHIVYIEGGINELRTFKITPGDVIGSLAGSPTTVLSDLRVASPVYDIVPYGNASIFVYSAAGPETRVGYITQSGEAGAPANGFPAVVSLSGSEDTGTCCCISASSNETRFFVGWGNTGAGVRGTILDTSLTEVGTRTTIEAATAESILNITSAFGRDQDSGGFTKVWIFWTKDSSGGTPAAEKQLHIANGDALGTTYTAPATYRGNNIASRAFRHGNHVYVNTTAERTLQHTYFTVREDGLDIARLMAGTAETGRTSAHLSQVQSLGSGKYSWCATFQRRLVIDPDDEEKFSHSGIKVVTFDWESEDAYSRAQAQGSLYLNGGHLLQYDGLTPVESGFHLFPDPDSWELTPAVGSGSLTSSATYTYIAFYEWDDAKGFRHQSAGIKKSVVLGGSDNEVTATFTTLGHTAKQDAYGRTNVKIVLYRTEADPTFGQPLYRVTSADPTTESDPANGILYNDPTSDTVSVIDRLADTASALLNNELAYTNTGELLNLAPPSAGIMVAGKERVFMAGLENTNEVLFSKLHKPLEGVAFSTALTISVPDAGGPITALALINETLIIFKDREIYGLAGDGPDNLGGGAVFSLPQLITSDTGCRSQRSVVRVPTGLMFQGQKGIYHLDQGLRVAYIGADVESFNAQTVTSAELMADKNQVRFLTNQGSTLLYDYTLGQWSTFTNHQGVDATLWRNVYTYVRANGEVLVETEGHFLDVETPYRLRMQTAWFKAAGLQSYMRLRRLRFIGNFKSSHVIRTFIGYDFEQVLQAQQEFDPTGVVNESTWGEGTWGSGVWGGAGSTVYQWQVHAPRQKCQSFTVSIEDVPSDDPGEGYELTEMLAEVGSKQGPYKLRAEVNATNIVGGGGGGPGGGTFGAGSTSVT